MDFYLRLVMSAEAVLDVGCGTGALLRRAREAGHRGRLCGLDPAEAMLQQARVRSDIEWVLSDLASIAWDTAFDLVVMTGHAFQVFLTDGELRSALATVHSALTLNGRFAFETRNPLAREWERWTLDNAVEFADAAGNAVHYACEVETPIEGDIVSFQAVYTSQKWEGPRVSRSTLRFLDVAAVSSFLYGAELEIEHQFGDWTQGPLTDASPEIITIAKRL